MQHVHITLSKGEVTSTAKGGYTWAKELQADIDKAIRWMQDAEEWAIKVGYKYVCPSCYDEVRFHDLDRAIRCSKTFIMRRDCEHDWSDASVVDDVCRKCGLINPA